MACAGILETGTPFITDTIRYLRGGMKSLIGPWTSRSQITQTLFLNGSSGLELKTHKRQLPLGDRVDQVAVAAAIFNDPAAMQHAPVTPATSSAIRSAAKPSSANCAPK